MGVHHFIGPDEPIILRLVRPGAREKYALRDIYKALQPVKPLLQFLADIPLCNPNLVNKNFELAGTNIAIPLDSVVQLITLLDRVENELLPKE